MKQSKMLELIKAWKALERRNKDLDFDLSKWSAELRAEFPGGASGDKACGQWLDTELAVAAGRKSEILERAVAFAIVADRTLWDTMGGFREIRHLVPLDKRERVTVLEAAKASSYRITTVIRQRESRPIAHGPLPDIVVLAEYVEQLVDVPDIVREAARRHVRARALKVA